MLFTRPKGAASGVWCASTDRTSTCVRFDGVGSGLRGPVTAERQIKRLPENYIPDCGGFSFAFKDGRREHSRAM